MMEKVRKMGFFFKQGTFIYQFTDHLGGAETRVCLFLFSQISRIFELVEKLTKFPSSNQRHIQIKFFLRNSMFQSLRYLKKLWFNMIFEHTKFEILRENSSAVLFKNMQTFILERVL